MGVPKFFRWMSERYPAISQLIAENRIPEFDCLYLDMNGIIHNCTHKDSDDATFRMSEEQMFIAIFNYIEHLFGKIKPKQLFFMAIDGVAPRAKMNQQRARRFRTALDVEVAREKAIKEGKEMPKEEAFDSNAITPGTEFMHKLTQQLKYFVNKKISEDVEWQGVEIVLSGHEVPGEGEHKIMEYIRLAKAQPDYDPNVRHCLYGLDADLIMLGLLSHDPHFCLLREEVTFGRQSKTKSKELEHQNFYLMQLCIVREYLALEFQELREDGVLGFPFDLERVIDDFILMAFFVGNDFLPHLPNLHINEGALALMFKIYKSVLPRCTGYINEGGVINMERLAVLLEELSHVEYRFFETEMSDQKWFKSKQMAKEDVMVRGKSKGMLTMTTPQREVWKEVKKYVTSRPAEPLDLPSTLPAAERKFAQELAESLHLEWKTVEDDQGDRHMQLSFPPKLDADEEEEEEDEESQLAILRVVKQYDKAKTIDISMAEAQAEMDREYEEKFQEWKDKYYEGKFDWDRKNETELTKLCENYVQGLQWVLYYYYQGVASWPWFYQYHYSPMISDVIKGLKADVNFKLGQPFHPYEQLMGVLPDRSKKIVPTVYHDLMTNPASPIIDFYPRDFELDMNGKKMEWEAVVKIPFIDEKRLLAAMAPKNKLLSEAEKFRNEFGVTLKFSYDPDIDFTYPSSLVGIFPDIPHCHCVENIFDLPIIEGLEYHIGLMEGVKLGSAALAGFPSLDTLPYNAALGFHGVNVFQQDSRNESMVVTLEKTEERTNVKSATARLGHRAFVGYPFLQEGKVVRVSDELFDYLPPSDGSPHPIQTPHGPREIDEFRKKAERIENNYSKRLGIIIGPVESITHVEMLKGLKKTDEGATVKEYGVIPGAETDYASQVVVDEVVSEDQRFLEKEAVPIEEEFPPGSRAFFLGEFNYGRPLEVVGHKDNRAEIWLSTVKGKEVEFGRDIVKGKGFQTQYTPSYAVAKMLGLHPLVLSKITSSFSISALGLPRLNLGLNLKFEAKKLKVLGYSRRSANGWEFSNKAIELLSTYMTKFPEFIAGIQRKPQGNEYDATDFYPAETANVKIKEIAAWLKTIESKNFEKVPLDAEQLDSDAVMAIETAADAALANGSGVEFKKLKGVPRNALMKPSDAEHHLGNQVFALGDRVVYAQDSGRVPIATRGTVVGISRTSRTTLLDVVFDVTFMSGTTLGDRCTPFRGSTVPAASVLNLTNKQVIAGSKAAAAKRPAPTSTPLTTRGGYGAPAGPGGRGQFREAGAPPPLRGSFRGAIAGQNGSRGNGQFRGRGRGGMVIDNAAPGVHSSVAIRGGSRGGRGDGPNGYAGGRGGGNTSFNAVPPPASLDARGGRGRGRGGRGRGLQRGRGGQVQVQQT
ncbi:5'-3' exoribonuclease 1 [Venustampulla echinocandica]|uniref:5'-3' exoribonuclease 1 n=1 Tax=Venustampulla echinocandica TaxID=2656787 RepID=A0A370TLK0_9HELO|nr:5'-3' exoribonuclease 1 [Venustampulla echinocandica]RDL36412.1 5'-3' exoribonuclease 1 [Venustampulla echinocandica]